MRTYFLILFIMILSQKTFSSEQSIYDSDVSLSAESIIIVQMLTHPSVQECIKQIESEYHGDFRIYEIVRRPKNSEERFEEGSAALAAHSIYFFKGTVGSPLNYKGPSAIEVERNLDYTNFNSKYFCKAIKSIYE
jgi:hypothetical protein